MVLGVLSIKTISFLVFCVFGIAALGYLLGRVTIKGVSLGTAGVFIVALLFGALLFNPLAEQLKVGGTSYVTNALKIVENLGLILFVTSVGFIAGPNFFGDFKKLIGAFNSNFYNSFIGNGFHAKQFSAC